MKNPPNFRRTNLFSDIYLQTFDFYNMQKLQDYDKLWIQNNEPGVITEFTRYQSIELFNLEAIYTITFTPKNPIGKDGVITMEWTEQVEFDQSDPVCKVETYVSFNERCNILFDDRKIEIFNVF